MAVPESRVTLIDPSEREAAGFPVRRVLPAVRCRNIGPFVFFDHFGPVTLGAGGMEVRPHPHIGLATVTFLFDGEVMHRDSLGFAQVIRPGAINWMTAGSGIAHSERTQGLDLADNAVLHGIQLWVALPLEHEEAAPAFVHYPASDFEPFTEQGSTLRLLAGNAYGRRAPTQVFSPMCYVEAHLVAGETLELPDDHAERATYVVSGQLGTLGQTVHQHRLARFAPGPVTLTAEQDAHFMIMGGPPLDAPRILWWNFCSSSQERIEQAKTAWRDGLFAKVPGDDQEFIPLPEGS